MPSKDTEAVPPPDLLGFLVYTRAIMPVNPLSRPQLINPVTTGNSSSAMLPYAESYKKEMHFGIRCDAKLEGEEL